MSRVIRMILPAALLGLLVGPAHAQTPSGPAPGKKAEPFKAYAVTGGFAGMSLDVVTPREGLPTVYLFIRADKWERPVARFVKTLDQKLTEGVADAESAEAVAVWLTENRDESAEYLPRAQQSLELERTMLSVFEGDSAGPNDWSVNREAFLTVVVVRNGKVVSSVGYQSVNETNVPAVLKALAAK